MIQPNARWFAPLLLITTMVAAGEVDPPSEPDGAVTFRPHPTLSPRQFVIEHRESPATAQVAVFRRQKGNWTRVQTLHGPQEYGGHIELLQDTTWRLEDFNFDGYLDVGLLWSKGPRYYCWLYDREAAKFVLHERLSELPLPAIDRKRRVLISHELHHFGYEEYQWRGGRLIRTKYVSEEEGLRMNAEGR
jgi:hypothetical protein